MIHYYANKFPLILTVNPTIISERFDFLSGTLLHICCAPCSIACIDTLRQEGIEPVGFWYNPNIHPMKEYKMRKNTLVEYAKSIDLKLEIENEYGLFIPTGTTAVRPAMRSALRKPHATPPSMATTGLPLPCLSARTRITS